MTNHDLTADIIVSAAFLGVAAILLMVYVLGKTLSVRDCHNVSGMEADITIRQKR